jgi:hypothetical protein
MTVQEDGTIKKKICLLTKQRSFVKNFETYIEYAKKSCTVCKDLRMLRYQILEEIRLTILQTQCIFSLLKKNVDSLETSLIHEGVASLKLKLITLN